MTKYNYLISSVLFLFTACSDAKIERFEKEWKKEEKNIESIELQITTVTKSAKLCYQTIKEDSVYYYYGYTDSLKTIVDTSARRATRAYVMAHKNLADFKTFINNLDKAHTQLQFIKQGTFEGDKSQAIAFADSLIDRLQPDLSRLRKQYAMQNYLWKSTCESYDLTKEKTVYGVGQPGIKKNAKKPNLPANR
ncbi:hypothetical protein SAMN05421780_1165 [Flexibacter flexilis DSM 6793]|uniref:Lipoprotein n=1 Tax=Flexibacter flexilis DSM 6793 TaxID=927664 RepID=A0A1I1NK47_9BACT|nr:hypothetical protein [Flexibacter flexilis]SFC97917.1 hypothetical protein SAMN05421780_1165 [Flexibacter flexilis DSM 6793]